MREFEIENKGVKIISNFVSRKAPNEITVSLGAHDQCGNGSNPGLNVSVAAVHIHPGFAPTSKHNDIALLRLRHLVPFNQFISPICMPHYGS